MREMNNDDEEIGWWMSVVRVTCGQLPHSRGAGDMEAAKSEANDPDAWHAGRTPVKLKQQQEAAGEYF